MNNELCVGRKSKFKGNDMGWLWNFFLKKKKIPLYKVYDTG